MWNEIAARVMVDPEPCIIGRNDGVALQGKCEGSAVLIPQVAHMARCTFLCSSRQPVAECN